MNNKTTELLEYNKIKELVSSYAISEYARERIDKLEPMVDVNLIKRNLLETTEARNIVNISSSIPIHGLNGVKGINEKLKKGGILSAEELEAVASIQRELVRLKRFMRDKEYVAPNISLFVLSTFELQEVGEEIERCIVRGSVNDRASSQLSKIRKRILILEDRIKSKLDNVLRNDKYKNCIQDSLVSQRNGRYVIPIKSEYKRQLEGDIHDKSQSGSTIFIEPAEVKKAQDELEYYRFEEEKEVYKILAALTQLVSSYEREININVETMAYYDFIFAKGKYSKSMEGNSVTLNTNNCIRINKGRHPLIGKEAVPLDFLLGYEQNGIVITGPNTGGKTVVLKTVGLLTMMVQSGLHVPVGDGSEFSVFADILADIGDGQSIEQSLSTFSSHLKNIINILNCADKFTLVIIDELGAGTDPGEGMGLAVAILEELYKKGAMICATTHYSEIKEFAEDHEGFINGSMEFDISSLRPLYKLNIGKAGESNAFLIALRLGMERTIIERAHKVTYKENKDYSKFNLEFNEEKINTNKVVIKHKEQIQKLKVSEKNNKISQNEKVTPKFDIGDCVFISFMNRTGIICEGRSSKGEYSVLVMKKKIKVSEKRLSKYIEKEELYPEDYDFDIVFKSKEYRKKDKLLSKRHVEGVEITMNEGEK